MTIWCKVKMNYFLAFSTSQQGNLRHRLKTWMCWMNISKRSWYAMTSRWWLWKLRTTVCPTTMTTPNPADPVLLCLAQILWTATTLPKTQMTLDAKRRKVSTPLSTRSPARRLKACKPLSTSANSRKLSINTKALLSMWRITTRNKISKSAKTTKTSQKRNCTASKSDRCHQFCVWRADRFYRLTKWWQPVFTKSSKEITFPH